MRKITKLKLASKSTKLRKKNMKEGNLPPVQQLPQKKSLMLLLKQTNPLVLISFGILLLVSVVLVVSLIFLIVLNKNAQRMSTQSGSSNELESGAGLTKINLPTSTPTPMPRPFLAGPHIFSVSSPENIILVKQIYISALDTQIGQSVTMKLDIQDGKSPIKSVTVKIISDKKSQTPVFSLKSGTASDGTWEGKWVTNDTHWYNYQAEISIKDAAGNTFSFTPTFR